MNAPASAYPATQQVTSKANPARPWKERFLQKEVLASAIREGFSPLQARLLAGRLPHMPCGTLRNLVTPRSADLPRAQKLPDIDPAVAAMADAITGGETLACLADHDADGQDAAVVVWKAMTEVFNLPAERLHIVPSHRLKEGYGVSAALVERVLALDPLPTCVLTVDQGSTDEPRIAELAAHGIRTIVTDHHHLPEEGPPASAVACVNPARPDSEFGDPTICGAMVAWYVMIALHQELTRRNWTVAPIGKLSESLSYVAVATCGDCVDLGMSHANRWAVQRGLARIAAMHGDQPVWDAFAPFVRNEWSASALSFQIVPRINAASRVGDARRGIEAMCATSLKGAYEWVQVLDDANADRKAIQQELTKVALAMAAPMMAEGAPALCLPFYEGGHAGVHGIVASRVVETYGVPVVCLSKAQEQEGLMTGSIRSVEGVHVKHVLDAIASEHPEFGLRYGGHAMAGGVRVATDKVPEFGAAWELACGNALSGRQAPPQEHDGELPGELSGALAQEMESLAPFGRGFPEARFLLEGDVRRVSPLGKDGKHLQLEVVRANGRTERVVWFGATAPGETTPDVRGHQRFVVQFAASTFAKGPGYDIKAVEWLRGAK